MGVLHGHRLPRIPSSSIMYSQHTHAASSTTPAHNGTSTAGEDHGCVAPAHVRERTRKARPRRKRIWPGQSIVRRRCVKAWRVVVGIESMRGMGWGPRSTLRRRRKMTSIAAAARGRFMPKHHLQSVWVRYPAAC